MNDSMNKRNNNNILIYKIKNSEVYEMLDIAEYIILRQIEETKASLGNRGTVPLFP